MERGPVQGTVWVEPGRLLAGPYPGNEVGWLAEAGVDVVLDLTSPRDGLDPYAARLAPEQRVVRRPVPDFEAPTATAMRETLDLLQLELDGGNTVYVHCRGGIGRTGTLLGCLLVRRGQSPDDALGALRAIGKHPETPDQVALVRQWPAESERRGRVTRGSRIQIATYVNRRPGELAQAARGAFHELAARDARICWTAPLLEDGLAEPSDRAFLRAVGREDLAASLAEFWPAGGPVWDALGIAVFPSGAPGVLLVEAKSYPGELRGAGCGATEPALSRIRAALAATRERLGAGGDLDAWLGPLYQSANRYAHLVWLRHEANVEAWLLHVLFVGDETFQATDRDTWEDELPAIERELGLEGTTVPGAGHAFLPALAATELTRKPARA